MIGSPRSYSSTKDSGVACLGGVPTHWKVRRLGQIGELSKGRGGSKADEVPSGIPCVRYGDLYTSHEFFVHASRSAIRQTEAENYTRIKFGDALFAGSGETIDEIGKSAVCLMRSEARCGGDIILFRCQVPVDARYLGYATGCRPAVLQKAAMGRGVTVMHVYADQLKRFALPIPPLSEQAAIVGFLDYVDRRIRRYVRSKEKLIALLEEQKQAVIDQAVTGQIDVRTGQTYPRLQGLRCRVAARGAGALGDHEAQGRGACSDRLHTGQGLPGPEDDLAAVPTRGQRSSRSGGLVECQVG